MRFRNKKVLVTGGAGFIGSHVVEKLLIEGAEVVVYDNFSTGKMDNLKYVKKDIEIIQGDIEDYEHIFKKTKKCNIIIHEAYPYGKSGMGLEQQYIETGIIGTVNVLKAAVKNNLDKVVNASSVSVYGIPKTIPIREHDIQSPFLPYGVTKYAGEQYCKTFSKLYGIDTISLRYFYAYGPRYAIFDHSALVNFLHQSLFDTSLIIYGTGQQIRDYTYIDDIVEGTLLAALKKGSYGASYNMSYGKGLSILDLAEIIKGKINKNLTIRFSPKNQYRYSDQYSLIPVGLTKKISDNKWIDERNYVGNITKAKKELGYNPKINIRKGLLNTVQWMSSCSGKKI